MCSVFEFPVPEWCSTMGCMSWRIVFMSVHVKYGINFPTCGHGPLARYVKLRVAHAPGMPVTFSPPPRVSDPDIHHGTCVTHVPWCMPGSLTSGFFWSRRRGNRSRHSQRMRNPQFYVSGKRPMAWRSWNRQMTMLRRSWNRQMTMTW